MADDSAAAPTSGAERAAQSAANFGKAIERIRQRADYSAKGLATVGTVAISAIGYAKLADVFPYGGPDWALAALFLGVVAMIVAVSFLVRRFHGASQSLITTSDVARTVALNDMCTQEEKLVRDAYQDTARLNDVPTLRAYEARGQRLERIADRLSEDRARELHARASQIFAEVKATHARAAAFVLRRRSTVALFAPMTFVLAALFVAGWYATALGADALQSSRADEIVVAKDCADARAAEAIVENELPGICGTPPAPKPEEETTAAQVGDEAIAALATARAACRKAAAKVSAGPEDCAPLERALVAGLASDDR